MRAVILAKDAVVIRPIRIIHEVNSEANILWVSLDDFPTYIQPHSIRCSCVSITTNTRVLGDKGELIMLTAEAWRSQRYGICEYGLGVLYVSTGELYE
jgi:hypothetical protein